MSPLAAAASYPPARRGPDGGDVAGTYVADPFRWLEDADAGETRSFVVAQNALARSVLDGIDERAPIHASLSERWTYPRAGVPFSRGGRWFQFRNSGNENQPVLWTMGDPSALGGVLLDPNALSDDGTVAITALSVSPDGALVAYSTSDAGSDWQTWRVRSVATRDDLADTLTWSKFSEASWLPDSRGFFYGAPERPAQGNELSGEVRGLRILLHRLGAGQSEDRVIFAPSEADWLAHTTTTPDGRYLVIYVGRGTDPANRLFVIDLAAEDLTPIGVVDEFAWTCQVVAASAESIWVLTDHGADRRHVLVAERRADGSFTPIGDWRVAVAEAPGLLLSATHCGGSLVCHYLEDAHSALRVFALDGSPRGTIEVPGVVTVEDAFEVGREVSGHPDDPVVFFNTMSFLDSGTLWRHDLGTGATTVLLYASVHLNDDRFVTERVFATRKTARACRCSSRAVETWPDGRAIPRLALRLRRIHRVDTPRFSVLVMVWLERGGVYAMANIRGGGEYGEAWHHAGQPRNEAERVRRFHRRRANTSSTAGWTSPGQLAINGGPTAGSWSARASTSSPSSTPRPSPSRRDGHAALPASSRRLGVDGRIRALRGPRGVRLICAPTRRCTTCKQRRQVPAHAGHDGRPRRPRRAGPFIQIHRRAPRGGKCRGARRPVLLRVATSAGHGAGKPVAMRVDEAADMLAFMEAALG